MHAATASLALLAGTLITNMAWPTQAIKLQLMDGSSTFLCDLPLINTGIPDPESGMLWATALYQNNQQCIPVAGKAAKVQVTSEVIGSDGAFCMDDFQMLPTAVSQSSAGQPTPHFPSLSAHCPSVPELCCFLLLAPYFHHHMPRSSLIQFVHWCWLYCQNMPSLWPCLPGMRSPPQQTPPPPCLPPAPPPPLQEILCRSILCCRSTEWIMPSAHPALPCFVQRCPTLHRATRPCPALLCLQTHLSRFSF